MGTAYPLWWSAINATLSAVLAHVLICATAPSSGAPQMGIPSTRFTALPYSRGSLVIVGYRTHAAKVSKKNPSAVGAAHLFALGSGQFLERPIPHRHCTLSVVPDGSARTNASTCGCENKALQRP